MSTAPDDFKGINRIVSKLEAFSEIPQSAIDPLAERFARVMTEDNRKGVLAGMDKDDNPMPPLKYRGGMGQKTLARKRTGSTFGSTLGGFKGIQTAKFGNLTTKEYQQYDGPRLAPRREDSRSIANYGMVEQPTWDGNTLTVTMGWATVFSMKGIPFLRFHFEGKGQKKYDLRGIRQWGKAEVRKSLREWVEAMLEAAS